MSVGENGASATFGWGLGEADYHLVSDCASLVHTKGRNPIAIAIGYGKQYQSKLIRQISCKIVSFNLDFADWRSFVL